MSTCFGYNLQTELHCSIRLHPLIKEAVIRVKLKRVHNRSQERDDSAYSAVKATTIRPALYCTCVLGNRNKRIRSWRDLDRLWNAHFGQKQHTSHYLNILQADLICIQWYLDAWLQKLFQISDGLIDVNVLLNQIRCSDRLLLDTTE